MSYPYIVQPLPYEYDALEPAIDAETVRIHHNNHYQTYVDKLNVTMRAFPQLQGILLEKLLTNPHLVPPAARESVQHNGGGVMNHYLFFNMLRPYRDMNRPPYDIEVKLDKSFGSYENFVREFSEAGADVFGSGYAILTQTCKGALLITTKANQDTVLPYGLKPLLLIDVWEHAYYLRYKSSRVDYLQRIWSVINWDVVL